jgi:uncharacterized protein DUF3631
MNTNNQFAESASEETQLAQVPDPAVMLAEVVEFFRRYLVATDDQLTVLALWCLHTYVTESIVSTPYLHISSPETQSGKSTCLQLLSVFSCDPWLTIGPTPKILEHKLLTAMPTVLLDDCHRTFNSRERQKIIALINAGFRSDNCYTCLRKPRVLKQEPWSEEPVNTEPEIKEIRVYCPKAFAGMGEFPSSLAERCIPIVLRRKAPQEKVERLFVSVACDEAAPLIQWMQRWTAQHEPEIERMALTTQVDEMLPNVLPLQHECAEPLLHIADLIGGPWPEKARTALANCFLDGGVLDSKLSLLLLADLRHAFASSGNPGRITTEYLLAYLCGLEDRPWNQCHEGQAIDGRFLAQLLRPFRISSRLQRTDPKKPSRGYRLKDFVHVWEHRLNPAAANALPAATQETATDPLQALYPLQTQPLESTA